MMRFIVVAAAVGLASARCPNSCSGHGTCEKNDACVCYANWQGADCSARTCPFGLAWVDTPSDYDDAHAYAECSNRGLCSRKSGDCECFDGYEGSACQRTTCPNECNGHGTCAYIDDLHDPTTFGSSFNADARNRGKPTNGSYSMYYSWDSQKTRGCKCDRGYSGADCSSRQCPEGDDPLTEGGDHEVQYIDVDACAAGATSAAADQFYLTFHDNYGGTWNTRPYDLGLRDVAQAGNSATTIVSSVPSNGVSNEHTKELERLLEDLPNFVIEDITITAGTHTNVQGTNTVPPGSVSPQSNTACDGIRFQVTFTSAHNSGDQKLLECHSGLGDSDHAGAQPRSNGMARGCTVTEHRKGSKESATCSNRGICGEDGTCECFEGYTDENCGQQSALV
jgi:hypothetical protein